MNRKVYLMATIMVFFFASCAFSNVSDGVTVAPPADSTAELVRKKLNENMQSRTAKVTEHKILEDRQKEIEREFWRADGAVQELQKIVDQIDGEK